MSSQMQTTYYGLRLEGQGVVVSVTNELDYYQFLRTPTVWSRTLPGGRWLLAGYGVRLI